MTNYAYSWSHRAKRIGRHVKRFHKTYGATLGASKLLWDEDWNKKYHKFKTFRGHDTEHASPKRKAATPIKHSSKRSFGNYKTPSPKRRRYSTLSIDSGLGNTPGPLQTMTQRGSHIKSNVHGVKPESSTSNQTYRARRSFHRSKYDKMNCSHGTFRDHQTEFFDSNTGAVGSGYFAKTTTTYGVSIAPFGMKSLSWFNSLRSKFIDRMNAAGIPNELTQLGGDKTAAGGAVTERLVEIVSWAEKHIIVNTNLHRGRIEIIDLVAKADFPLSTTEGDPIQMMTIDQSISSHAGFSLLYDNPDWNIGICHQFRKSWGIAKRTEVWLEPGQQHIHYVKHKCNFTVDRLKQDSKGMVVGLNTDFALKGLTTVTYYRISGGPVHRASGAYDVTIDGARFDVVNQIKVYAREVQPYKDYFTWELNTSWPATGLAKTAVATVEEHNPVSQIGV